MGAVLVSLAALRMFGVSIIPVITNDSVGYLSHATSLSSDGMVWSGFRQIGYPAYLASVDFIGTVTSTEPILLAMVVQRGFLVVGCAYAIWLLRWWAAPLVVVMTAPDLVGYTNFVLAEGISMPLVLLLGLLMTHAALLLSGRGLPSKVRHPTDSDQATLDHRSLRLIAVLTAVGVATLTLLKYQSIVFILPLLAVLFAMHRMAELKRLSVIVAVAIVTVLSVTSLVQSLENGGENDDFFPLSRGVRNAYWGTFQNVFTLHPENRTSPDLEEFFDGGSPWPFIREVESTYQTYPEQREVFENAINAMLEAAGLDKREEQAKAVWASMRGGRIDDVAGFILEMRSATATDVYDLIHSNGVADERGRSAYLRGYNGGQAIEPVLTAPLFPTFSGLLARPLLQWIGPLMICVMLVAALLNARIRIFLFATVISAMATFGFLGALLVDNYRYVVTTLVFLIPISTFAAMTLDLKPAARIAAWHRHRSQAVPLDPTR